MYVKMQIVNWNENNALKDCNAFIALFLCTNHIGLGTLSHMRQMPKVHSDAALGLSRRGFPSIHLIRL